MYFIFDENYWFCKTRQPEFIYNFIIKNEIKFKELKENINYFFEPITKNFTDDERNELKNQISPTTKKITKVPILTLVYQEFMQFANISKFKSSLKNIRTCPSALGFNNLIHMFFNYMEGMTLINIRSFFDKRKKEPNELNIHKLICLVEDTYDLEIENNKLLLLIYEDLNNLTKTFETNKYWDSISKDIAHFQTTGDYENLEKSDLTMNKLFNIFEEIYFYLKILAYLLFKSNVQLFMFFSKSAFEDMFDLNTICSSLSIYDVYSQWVKPRGNFEIIFYLREKKVSKLSDLSFQELIDLEKKILEKINKTNLNEYDQKLLNSDESKLHSQYPCIIRGKIIVIMDYFRQILLIKKELFNKSINK